MTLRTVAVLSALVLAGCGGEGVVGPSSDSETQILADTARFSGVLGQHVRGEISTKYVSAACPVEWGPGDPCHGSGWYEGGYGRGATGIAYYYRPDVAKGSEAANTRLAAHEVCHSLTGPEHDAAHAACITGLLQ